MGLCLIAETSSLAAWGTFFWGVFMAAAGLGFIIFVHELGHFAVARMCGVKCDKFMVGFDFFGLKLSKKWGETEYGIGVFPLGGYVKMLGQDDDPSKAAEQIEATKVTADSEFAKEITGPDGEKRYIDRRSYQAKSVPQRMAIISAGVIMNVIFAIVFAFFAYGMGVEYRACQVAQVTPGAPAWRAGIEPGDDIVRVGSRQDPSFEHLLSNVSLSDMQEGVSFGVRRARTGEVEDIVLHPEKTNNLAIIGVSPDFQTTLNRYQATFLQTAAASAEESFLPNDQIVAINGEPIQTHREMMTRFVALADQAIDVTIRRQAEDGVPSPGPSDDTGDELTIKVAPTPAKRLGLVMSAGPIAAIQKGSPAEDAGLEAGDQILAIDGQPLASPNTADGIDPVTIARQLAASQQPVTMVVQRATKDDESPAPREVTITPRAVTWLEQPGLGGPMPVPALGIALRVEPTVAAVIAGSPAEEAGIVAGDRLMSAQALRADPKGEEPRPGDEVDFTEEPTFWPAMADEIRGLPDGSQVKLSIKRGEETIEHELEPTATGDDYLVRRGFRFAPLTRKRECNSLGEQASLAVDYTWFQLTTVVRMVQKLISQQVPTKQLGGPLTILGSAYYIAISGGPEFLLFLTLISANLAVLNFLPIPVLDGGHMVFLAYEGITGKQANEKLAIGLQLVGMAMLLTLMIYVTKNDIVRWFF